jgi:hypothetical protein
VFVTALGNSDTHHLTSVLAGFPRSYVVVDEATTDPFDEEAFLAALRGRRVVATTGPWLDVRVGGGRAGDTVVAQGGEVSIEIGLRQASYVRATRVRVWVGGVLVETLEVPAGARAFDWTGTRAVPADTWIAVDAIGDEPLPVEMTGDYLPIRGRPGLAPFALVNPILVDATGDGFALPGAKPAPRVDVAPRPGGPLPDDCFEPLDP